MVGMWTESKHTSQRMLAPAHYVFFPHKLTENHQIIIAESSLEENQQVELNMIGLC